MSAGEIVDGAVQLAEFIAGKLADRTGFDRAVTYDIARAAAREWVTRERKAVTAARETALKKADAKRAIEGRTKREDK